MRYRNSLLALSLAPLAAATASRAEDAQEPVRTVYRLPIEGTIDLGLAPFVSRIVSEASKIQGSAVLLEIDTFGGRMDAAVLIRDALIEAPVPTIAFIHPRAISAGALISLACETIVMAPGGSIGAATPVTGGEAEKLEAADEKVVSYMRTEMRTTAEKRGRRGDVAEAMVDRDVEIEGVIEKGKVLTLSTEDALKLKVADHQAASLEAALESTGLSGARIVETEPNWAEVLARVVSDPTLSSLLLSLGFLGILIELYQPGWGLPGSLGIASLAIFFFGHHVAQLAGWEEVLIFAAGVLLLIVEIFVIPGFGIAGIAGIALMLTSVVLSLLAFDFRVSRDLGLLNRALLTVSTSVILTVVLGYLAVRLLPATGASRRLVLGQALTIQDGFTSHDTQDQRAIPLGTMGEAATDLRPAGKVRVEGRKLDAVSEGGYIGSGARVRIVEWRAGTAVVREEREVPEREA
jgi:membrane-bound serine protease (ClpP class)